MADRACRHDRPAARRAVATARAGGIPPRQRRRVSLLIGLLAAASSRGWAQESASPDAFGRWEQPLRHCRIERWPAPVGAGAPAGSASPGAAAATPQAEGPRPAPVAVQGCQRLRLDQQVEGLLVVRWLGSPSRGLRSGRQLAFAGMLDRGSPPMRCSPEGRCRPVGPMAVWLSAVATTGFGPALPAGQLPSSRLAQGLCRLEERRILCEATERDGSRWRGEARR